MSLTSFPFLTSKAFRAGGRIPGSPLIVGLVTLQSDTTSLASVPPDILSCGMTTDASECRAVLPPHLAAVADVAAAKPLRILALQMILQRRQMQTSLALMSMGDSGDEGRGVQVEMGTTHAPLAGGDRR